MYWNWSFPASIYDPGAAAVSAGTCDGAAVGLVGGAGTDSVDGAPLKPEESPLLVSAEGEGGRVWAAAHHRFADLRGRHHRAGRGRGHSRIAPGGGYYVRRFRRPDHGPAFLLCHTYRYLGHHVGDINRDYYRSNEEEQEWKSQRDPLKLLSDWLIEHQLADGPVFDQIESQVRAEVAAAVEYALGAPFPAPEEVGQHVYA